jgi:two-component system CheB/CheR fusion protein
VEPPGTDGTRLIIEVSDTGIGIAPQVLPRIFDAFEQGEDALRRRSAGLGLGLAISRSLARAHGGDLTAASPGKGQGSVFTLELPAIPRRGPEDRSSAPAGAEQSPRRPLRILLVEDNKDTLKHFSLILGLRGHEVRVAERLSEALDAAAAEVFDLVISDIELPDGTGLELLRRFGDRDVPAIAMSGYGTEEDVQQSLAAGFDEHLTKPVDIQRLEEAIRRVTAKIG